MEVSPLLPPPPQADRLVTTRSVIAERRMLLMPTAKCPFGAAVCRLGEVCERDDVRRLVTRL